MLPNYRNLGTLFCVAGKFMVLLICPNDTMKYYD